MRNSQVDSILDALDRHETPPFSATSPKAAIPIKNPNPDFIPPPTLSSALCEVRCRYCNKNFGKIEGGYEIECPRCGKMNRRAPIKSK